ncbi:hypothetical protein DdX_14505 [Ditylenchus destructor]|uniref:Uncharacterized protein n=1 Tax=Ditylenchus destructor TaxID=166010 RepID=A0AAD4MSJ7_9BILA|nr:hypothetical protein DdX_14505 [Ditylenchus destructor]
MPMLCGLDCAAIARAGTAQVDLWNRFSKRFTVKRQKSNASLRSAALSYPTSEIRLQRKRDEEIAGNNRPGSHVNLLIARFAC